MNLNRLEVLHNQCTGGTQQTFTCGGTADVLPKERAKASFNCEAMTNVLDGGKKLTARKRFIRSPIKNVDYSKLYGLSRSDLLKEHVKEFIRIHKQFPNFQPTKKDIDFMSEAGLRGGSINNHLGLFLMTIIAQADEEQKKWWAKKAITFEIVGNYCQTELGHGSNIRAIQTTAHFDKTNQQFVLNTPTLQSYKWWPGCLAKVSTHAVVMAQLIIDDKEYGMHAFMCQIRDENHKPLAGIELGDLGPKIGDDMNDTGYMSMKNVRIPREYLLAQYQIVTPEGQYIEKNKVNKKTLYSTMLYARAHMIFNSASRLACACIIATRYSCVRKQGFLDTSQTAFKSEERQIIDYQIQQYRVFKQIGITIAMKFAGIWMNQRLVEIEGDAMGGQLLVSKDLKEIAAFSAGLKSLCTFLTTEGIEDLRKSVGGNGYLLSSGIAQIGSDFLWQVTAEGDFIILQLLTAKFLLKSVTSVMGGKQQKGSLSYLNVLLQPEFVLEKCMPQQAKDSIEYTNPTYLTSWFQYRALAKIINAGKEMQGKMMEDGLALDDAWNNTSLDLLAATQAHSYFILMENFAYQITKIKDEKVKNVLTKVCILFGCTQILDGQWTGILPSSQMHLVKKTAYDMMKDIRPECVTIVDSFDMPDNILASNIGRFDGNVYEALYDSAKKSSLNKIDPFDGYDQYLKPHLNIEFLKLRNGIIPPKHKDQMPGQPTGQQQSKL